MEALNIKKRPVGMAIVPLILAAAAAVFSIGQVFVTCYAMYLRLNPTVIGNQLLADLVGIAISFVLPVICLIMAKKGGKGKVAMMVVSIVVLAIQIIAVMIAYPLRIYAARTYAINMQAVNAISNINGASLVSYITSARMHGLFIVGVLGELCYIAKNIFTLISFIKIKR